MGVVDLGSRLKPAGPVTHPTQLGVIMAKNFGSLVFTPAIKNLQERHGSRRQYERLAAAGRETNRFGPDELAFIAARDSFYLSSVTSNGWPYIQHRGGPAGFLKVIDDRTLAFADFVGNRQYVTTGNLATDDRVALILMDYPNQARLKILGHAETLEGTAASHLIDKVRDPGYKAKVERVVVLHLEAFDWNCPQHITARYTASELREALEPIERRMQQLEEDNARLHGELTSRPDRRGR